MEKMKKLQSEIEGMEFEIFNIIINASDCKNHAYEALKRVTAGDYDEAKRQMDLSRQAIEKAGHFQENIT